MKYLKVADETISAIEKFQLPEDLAFGKVMSPIMIECDFKDGKWGELNLLPYSPISIDPTCKVLHYAQEIFEGLKAYKVKGKGPYLFRPEENLARFNLSAKRMAMQTIPDHLFSEAISAITTYSSQFIPGRSGDSLYIRPFMFASDSNLGIKPSESFKFMVVASPSSAYFSGGSVRVLIERSAVRACPGGVGAAKTGGNYAASLLSMVNARKLGFDQVLWLDAVEKKYVEEMSGMNVFAVYGDELVTPSLTETILNGITRKSILELSRYLGIKVKERPININELLQDVQDQKCTEAFACGTAVIITPINGLGEAHGKNFPLKYEEGPVAKKLRDHLLGIQEGVEDDPFNWRKEVPTLAQLKKI